MFQKEIFQKRLKQLREEHPQFTTQKEFSEFIEVSQPTLVSYERGSGKPPIDVLCNIAEKCKVSVDWLCGASDVRCAIDKAETYADAFETLTYLRDKIGFKVEIFKDTDPAHRDEPPSATISTGFIPSVFLEEWESVYTAYKNGSIKEKYYRLIMNDMLSKYDVLVNDEKEFDYFVANWEEDQQRKLW